MVQKRSAGEIVFDVFNVLFMLLLVFITLYPLYYVAMCSISDSGQLMGSRLKLFFQLADATARIFLVLNAVTIGLGLQLLGHLQTQTHDLAPMQIIERTTTHKQTSPRWRHSSDADAGSEVSNAGSPAHEAGNCNVNERFGPHLF